MALSVATDGRTEMSRYILGTGINALIFAYYNPDFKIIDPLNDSLKPMPKIMDHVVTLHDTTETRELLKDIGWDSLPAHLPIKYFFNGKYYPYMPEPVVSDYVQKKMGGREDLMDRDRTLSVPGDTFNFLENKITDIYERLMEDVVVHHDELLSITPEYIKLNKEGRLRYEFIVSTIPANFFWNYWQGRKPEALDLKYGGATFKVCDNAPEQNTDKFAFAYFADARPYHRVFGLRDKYVYEYSGKYDIPNASYLPVSYIKTDKHNIPPDRILFCGRHATWRHWWKIQDTIRLSRSRFTWESMWNRQAFFQTNFSDLNRDTGELTEDTIYYITCLTGELHEMLQELNWKKWKPGDKPDRAKVLTEYIDAVKFLMAIGAIWDFDPEEIHREFIRKSNEVEEKYYDRDASD